MLDKAATVQDLIERLQQLDPQTKLAWYVDDEFYPITKAGDIHLAHIPALGLLVSTDKNHIYLDNVEVDWTGI